MTLPGKTQPKSENNYIPLPDQTQQKSNNPPLPNKKTNVEGEGSTSAHKMYTTFLYKIFYYYMIPPFKHGYNL